MGQFYCVAVHNVSLSKKQFDALCDILSYNRPYASDYRTNKDADTAYWHSGSYLPSEGILLDAVYDDVKSQLRDLLAHQSVTIQMFPLE